MIVQALQEIQHRFGFLPTSELRSLAERTGTPLYRLHEVASFFPHFRRTAPPKVEVKICRDMACHLRGSDAIIKRLEALAKGLDPKDFHVEGVSCLGRCDRAPASYVVTGHEHRNYVQKSAEEFCTIAQQTLAGSPPPPNTDASFPDESSKWEIDIYRGEPKYSTVRGFIDSPDRDAERKRVLKALETAGLIGMGGAGGRTFKKWSEVLEAAGDEKYVVVNGDESEPGTFKDRELLLRTPYLVLEGVILGGLVCGATRGYIYIRHEYEEQIEATEKAIREAEKLGFCGENILGSGISFPVEVFVSPGGYICGEQTALIEAMEDKRAEPRNRPPELQTNGLWDKPTLLNNVETMAWVPACVTKEDGKWYSSQGTGSGKGRRFFSISGDLNRPGAYEVPSGITLRQFINDYCGGMRDGQALKAFAPSGPSGGFLPAKLPVKNLSARFVKDKLPPDMTHFDILDLELDTPVFREMGLMLGGGMVVYGDKADLVEQALACQKFYRNESCGKCVPCRIGSQKLVEIATDVYEHRHTAESLKKERQNIQELAETMVLTAICGLGTVAPNPLTSVLEYFPADVERYLNNGR